MHTKIKPLNKKNVYGQWEFLAKLGTNKSGESLSNFRCLKCGNIKCLKRSLINTYECDCKK